MASQPINSTSTHILIIGGGLAGLALGQGLKQHGIPFHIFERDPDVSFRAQGYRIRISTEGGAALQRLMPEHLWQAFEASCGKMIPGGHRLDATTGEDEPPSAGGAGPGPGPRQGPGGMPGSKAWNADRSVLRSLLLSGLEEDVTFGKRFLRYETVPDGDVQAHFADGSLATGSCLVGADGTWSPVRQQLMPDFELLDTGSRAVFGKTPLKDGVADRIPAAIMQGICITGHGRGTPLQLFTDTMDFDRDAAMKVEADLRIAVPADYVYWVLLFSLQTVEARGGNEALHHMSETQSVQLSLDLTNAWHDSIRTILSEQDPESASTLAFHTTTPDCLEKALEERTQKERRDPQVVLVGDSKHPMPPVGGVGANSAFQDVAALCEVLLQRANDGPEWYREGLAEFENGVHERSKAAVGLSAGGAGRIFGMKPISEMEHAKQSK